MSRQGAAGPAPPPDTKAPPAAAPGPRSPHPPPPDVRVAGFREALARLRPYRRSMLLALVLGFGGTAAGALQPVLVRSMVNTFDGGVPALSVCLLVALLVASAALTGVRQLVLQRAGERFAFDTRERLIRRVFALPVGVLEGRERGDVISRVTTDVTQIRAILSSGLVELASSLVTVAVSVVMMAFLDWTLLALTLLVIVAVVTTILHLGRRVRPSGLRLQTAIGELASALSRALAAMRTIRATSATRREADATVREASRALDAGLATAGLRAVVQTFAGVTVQVLLIAVLAVGALRVASGSLSVGDLSAFIMYLMLMVAPVSTLAGVVSMLGEAFGALSRILAVEALEPERDVEERPAAALPAAGAAGEPLFELRDVSFRYPTAPRGAEAAALRAVTVGFEQGATTAIVGPSGAGKSTLFALLERFHEPTGGRILFRGQDVTRLSREALRGEMAYVEQDAPALSGTIRDNLLLGDHRATDEQCLAVLARLNLLPGAAGSDLLDAEVGESGLRLSGGERQRLAIGRALIAGTPVLLLDEVTSNLDSNNERVVQDIIRAGAGDRSVIVIAHRLSTVVAADAIIVLDQGRIVARGTHQELLRDSALYRELAHTQLLDG
ncbi:ABC transporter ATP-binding protein [Streptomyces hainanensis]|uniref:ABC transporter ATP-binding protein n=1 Tax=Streptomyces hainanensis TaxID=402648 RepID=A0A4R4TPF8_9ACTN|nr:ABC transporter ATP-binding protein [Streptomyces hainanensis]TDC78636.1 ABC transporter ATP-binding protein [Streptomyces hainanensis]